MIKAGIIGGAGYTGGELLRILINHPEVDIRFVHSNSNAGNPLYKVHADLIGETELIFTSELDSNIDVLFLCVGHGEARKFLQVNHIADHIRIIDLSQDFRLHEKSEIEKRHFIYGLPELNRAEITKAHNIANPGCFATGIQLGLIPLAKYGLLDEVHTTGITGATGAGQGLSQSSHFSWRANNIQAYKTLSHQHLHEIGESILQLQPTKNMNLNFIPWRGDFTRGIFISSMMHCDMKAEEIHEIFHAYYDEHPFTDISSESIFLKQVINTNKCIIQTEKVGSKLVVHSILDNLIKGASGQAVQNMNIMFGLNETAGLKLKASYF